MKKALVTGATGFIGSWVVDELISHGIEVIAIVRESSANLYRVKEKNIRVVSCEMSKIDKILQLIPDRDIDIVYHFAWQGVANMFATDEKVQLENVANTLKLIRLLPELGCNTFVGAGSIHEIEINYEMHENKRISNAALMYKAAKAAAHWMGKTLAGELGIRFFWPIISNTYGVGEKSGRLINTIIRAGLKGETIPLTEGKQNYDFVYISDVASAFYLIGMRGVDGTNYFIGSGTVKPLRSYLQEVITAVNNFNESSVQWMFGNKKTDVVYLRESEFDISNLERDTGYKPKVAFEEGIRETIIWIINNE